MTDEAVPLQLVDTGESPGSSRTYQLDNFSDMLALVRDCSEGEVSSRVGNHISSIVSKHGLDDKYKTVLLFDEVDELSSYHSNQIYEATSQAKASLDILLIVSSRGGQIEPAYLISKTCKRLAKNRFVVAVPRKAKSAATLLALGADEIHMGLMSELGPIDPQIDGYPALSLSNALNVVAELSCSYPASSSMFAQYLTSNLDLKDLGYLKRVGESAIQYAERLLSSKKSSLPRTPTEVADHFVNHYKDHGFVIDVDEATALLGSGLIRQNSAEYRAANEIYQTVYLLAMASSILKSSEIYYVGDIDSGLTIRRKRKKKA